MKEEYKDKEKRKQYLIDYRNKTREKRREYSKKYYKKIGKEAWYKKYGNQTRNGRELAGTSGLGRKYEKVALKLLKGSKDCNKEVFSGKWDIEWNGLRIDVKMRNKNKRGYWGFTTKKNPIADYYLCFCVEDGETKKIYFIPKGVFRTSVSIIENKSVLDKYIVVL